jgi:hypothetical protein
MAAYSEVIHMPDYAMDFIKAELQVGLTFSILGLQSMCADKTSRNTAHVRTTAQQPLQQDMLLALSFCPAVYGLTLRGKTSCCPLTATPL